MDRLQFWAILWFLSYIKTDNEFWIVGAIVLASLWVIKDLLEERDNDMHTI
jgi:hypothetical protein